MLRVQLEEAAKRIRLFVDENSQFWNPASQPTELFHYTSVEGFIGIISYFPAQKSIFGKRSAGAWPVARNRKPPSGWFRGGLLHDFEV